MARNVATARARVAARAVAELRAFLAESRRPSGPHPYVALLGLKAFDTAGLHEKLRRGLAFGALERFLGVTRLSLAAAADLLDIPPRTIQRRKEEGRLQPDESDRLVRLARVVGLAIGLFEGDADATMVWLGSPVEALGDVTPLELSRSEPGSLEVERLIGRLEHGVFA